MLQGLILRFYEESRESQTLQSMSLLGHIHLSLFVSVAPFHHFHSPITLTSFRAPIQAELLPKSLENLWKHALVPENNFKTTAVTHVIAAGS